ncbi:MAG TPA: glycosyl hydrolase 115 family protein, partial [Nitrospira sp.]|nr:glycosyl hydrolase 115 family protein [Nitrospira sp.]
MSVDGKISRRDILLGGLAVSSFSLLGPISEGRAATPPGEMNDPFGANGLASIAYDIHSGVPIRKAAELLSHDLAGLTGMTPKLYGGVTGGQGDGVIIGLASSPAIAALLQKNRISTAPISGKWESYGRTVVPAPWDPSKRALLIFGSDPRGTIWGVIDLTREVGVSAWEWWADVTIRKVDRITIRTNLHYSKEPTVKYRGFFINSSGLAKWARETFDPAQSEIGPKTYARVFELMWRLKANVLWPALFNEVPENYDTAREYAVMRGSSHIEMMLRDNQREWDEQKWGHYNWFTNRDRIEEYWRTAIEKFGKYENIYTLGMRGIDDVPLEGANTPEARAAAISDAIAAQRKILSEVLHKPADQIPQILTLYKEVTAAYNTGKLIIPPDVVLNWAEDNFGYDMQMSNVQEQERPGGSGMYYHAIFWGAPAGYTTVVSTDPALMREEMMRAYHQRTRAFWILNVGAIKPCEFMAQFFLDMAFNANAFEDPHSAKTYLRDWIGTNFGADRGDQVADIMWRYYKLGFDRNPEFMTSATVWPESSVQQSKFNILDFGDENARRVDAYISLTAEAAKLKEALPDDRKAAFYQLVQYTIEVGAAMNFQQLNLDRSILYGLQHRASANVYSDRSKLAYQKILSAIDDYNSLENDRWRGFAGMQAHLPAYQPPYTPVWQTVEDEPRCGVQVEGGGYFNDRGFWFPTLPSFHRELGDHSYYLDVFNQLPTDGEWNATTRQFDPALATANRLPTEAERSAAPTVPWIKIDRTAGRFSARERIFEQRLQVSVDWSKAPNQGEGLITIRCSAGKQPIDVHVRIAPEVVDKDVSFIESQGVVSMYATHADVKRGDWQVIEDLGHTGGVLRTDLNMAPVDAADSADLANAPYAEYHFGTAALDRNYNFPNYVLDYTAKIRAIGLPVFPIAKD